MSCCTAPTACTKARYTVAQNENHDGTLTWQVLRYGAKRFCASGLTNKEAVAKGRALAKKNKGCLTVLAASGDVRFSTDYSA